MTTIEYVSSDVTRSGQYTSGGNGFTTNVGGSNITYGISNNIVTNVSINFFCNTTGVTGYNDLVIGITSYNIYSPYTASTPSFTSSGPNAVATNIAISGGTIRITGNGEWHSQSNPAASSTVTFDVNFNLNTISASTDFVFVNTGAMTNPPTNILFLPPLFESSTSTSKLLFIKDKIGNAATNNITVLANEGVSIDNKNAPYVIKDEYGCLTLFNNGIYYFIANYYPSNGQPIMPNMGSTIVPTIYANNNTVNIFETTANNGRNTGTNSIYLRNPSGSPGISIIKYVGSADGISRTSANPLLIVPDACLIDSLIGGDFLLYVDDPVKSCGAVFITDGANWYIAGYYNSTNWNWTSYSPLSGSEIQISQASQLDINTKAPTSKMNPAFTLPQTVSAYPYLCIIKKQGIPLGANTNYFSYALGTPTSGKFNFNNNNIVYTQPQNNTCLWVVANSDGGAGSFTYDPVIAYTA
jgi:hypothetical protein